ncbi:MFS transporter [Kribbella turkmenica]|nr:MFS transporter [Kribbella turkmenica]
MLEWLDFGIYAYVAAILAKNFFPTSDPTTALLASFATFGVGFAARPVGAVVFGRLGDVRGRRMVLLTTLTCMAVGTFGIAALPTYESIGILAPILLVCCRLLQGFSAGGEATTATAYLVEWAPAHRRGLYGSFLQIGSIAGFLGATLIVAAVSTALGKSAMQDWGWRLPFVVGGVLIVVGYVLRRRADETPEFTAAQDASRREDSRPDASTVVPPTSGTAVTRIARAFALTAFWSVSFYFFLTYMPTYLSREFGLESTAALWITSAAMLCHVVLVPVAALMSDRFGRKPLLIAGCIGFILLPIPLFAGLSADSPLFAVFAAVFLVGAVLALYGGAAPAALAEYFPVESRSTGMAIGYNLATVVFGGFTPFIATWLIEATGQALAPAYYVAVAAVGGLIFVALQRETAPLRAGAAGPLVQPAPSQGGETR